MQKFQDWFTQQWVKLRGRKIEPIENKWLLAPFGNLNGIGEEFIYQLAEKENLIVERNLKNKGLLQSIKQLHLQESELKKLSIKVIDFYEHTSNYKLNFSVKWSSLFWPFGFLVNKLFSSRINQLNIPISNVNPSENLTNEIIELVDPKTTDTKYTIWLRKSNTSGKVIYSGIYGTCRLPSGSMCIKAVFPLPNGNATVIMKPEVGTNTELILDSSGKKFGDAGFYFLLRDPKGSVWAQYISSFTDKLIISDMVECLKAEQTLKLWGITVVRMNYNIVEQSLVPHA